MGRFFAGNTAPALRNVISIIAYAEFVGYGDILAMVPILIVFLTI